MNDLTPMPSRASGPACPPASVPAISPDLDVHVRRVERGDSLDGTTQAVAEAAGARLATLATVLTPGTQRAAWAWFQAFLNSSVSRPRAPTSQDAIKADFLGIWETCFGLPAAVWNNETRIAFQATQRFHPTPADVFLHLQSHADVLRRQRRACQALVDAHAKAAVNAPELPEDEESKQAAKERVSALAAAWRMESTGNHETGPETSSNLISARPAFVSRQNLLGQYEALERNAVTDNAKRCAALRAASIRRLIASEPDKEIP